MCCIDTAVAEPVSVVDQFTFSEPLANAIAVSFI